MGQISLPGHENAVRPYRDQSDSFWIVPMSTFSYKGNPKCLCDISVNEELKGEEWKEVLFLKIDEAVERGEPLVLSIHGWLTGNEKDYDFWRPFLAFLDYAQSKKITFGSTKELIEIYARGKIEDLRKGKEPGAIPQYKY